MWELPSWQSYYELTPADWPALRDAVRDALAGGPITRDELGAAVTAQARFRHLGIAGLGDRLAEVDIDGSLAYVLREDLDDLAATPATGAVRLLPGYDQWVLGPGTADTHVVPPARRPLVSRQGNLVVAGGVVSGTWSATGDELVVGWFAEAGPPPRDALAGEVARLATILGRPHEPVIRTD
jgi:hypothetical protein